MDWIDAYTNGCVQGTLLDDLAAVNVVALTRAESDTGAGVYTPAQRQAIETEIRLLNTTDDTDWRITTTLSCVETMDKALAHPTADASAPSAGTVKEMGKRHSCYHEYRHLRDDHR